MNNFNQPKKKIAKLIKASFICSLLAILSIGIFFVPIVLEVLERILSWEVIFYGLIITLLTSLILAVFLTIRAVIYARKIKEKIVPKGLMMASLVMIVVSLPAWLVATLFFLDTFLIPTPVLAPDARIAADLSQARTIATLISEEQASGYTNVCDGSGGLNISLSTNPNYHLPLSVINIDIGNNGGDVTCQAATTTFCIESSLSKEGYYCRDSDGRAGEASSPSCISPDSKCNLD